MKKILCCCLALISVFMFVSCGKGKCCSAIELMGAGDRIHDSFTFANTGVKIKDDGKNVYTISGSVEKLTDENVKKEFGILESVEHVVAIKLTAIEQEVVNDEVEIYVDGAENYDAEHLNGSDFTFIILQSIPNNSVSVSVKWNKNADKLTYILNFDADLVLK